jgi:hypothetical protein
LPWANAWLPARPASGAGLNGVFGAGTVVGFAWMGKNGVPIVNGSGRVGSNVFCGLVQVIMGERAECRRLAASFAFAKPQKGVTDSLQNLLLQHCFVGRRKLLLMYCYFRVLLASTGWE